MKLLIVFLCGVGYEITSTYWLFASERLKPWQAGFWSLMQVIVMLTGISESIRDVKSAICFAIGYSLGSFIGVSIEKNKWPVKGKV